MFVDASIAKVNGSSGMKGGYDHARTFGLIERLNELYFTVAIDPFDRLHHKFSISRGARPNPARTGASSRPLLPQHLLDTRDILLREFGLSQIRI